MAVDTRTGGTVENTYDGYTVRWRCKQVTSITTNTTTVQVTIKIYAHFDNSAHIYYGDLTGALVVDNSIINRAPTQDDMWPSDNTDVLLITRTITYTRSTTNTPHTVSSYVQITGGAWEGTSSTYKVKLTINVPALPSYTVSYNIGSGASGTIANQTKYYGKTLTLSSTRPTRTGYTFQGWADSSGSSTVRFVPGGYYYDNQPLSLYAVWAINSYTITANANGGAIAQTSGWTGTGTTATKTFTYNSNYSFPSVSRSGYNLDGWYTAATGGTKLNNTTNKVTANATIYAHWSTAYIAPTAKIIVAKRCDSSGSELDDGTYAYIKFNWTLGSESVLYYQVFVKTQNSSSYTPVDNNIKQISASPETFISSSAVLNDANSAYDVKIELYNSSSATSILATTTDYISPAYFIMDINAEGTAIGFGTSVSDDNNGFYCNMNATFDQSALFKQGVNISSGQKYKINGTNLSASDVGALASSIVHVTETGSGSGWYWRKWSNGSVEAWGSYTFSSTAGTAWSSGMYYYNATVSIPSGIFPAKPLRAFATSSGDLQWMVAGIYITSATSVTVRLVKPVSSSQPGGVYIYLWY